MTDISDRPPYLTDIEYNYILQRDKHRCVWQEECERAGKHAPCSKLLTFDHKHPRSLGRIDGYPNLRLLCERANCGRPVEPDPKWIAPNRFDSPLRTANLREIQRLAGADQIEKLERVIRGYESQIGDNSDSFSIIEVLRKVITLIPGSTGIGKTILIQSIFHAINAVVGLGRPRVCNVLLLTVDHSLRDQTGHDLEDEMDDHGIVSGLPTIKIIKKWSQLLKGPEGAAITVACAQTLFKVKDEGRDDGQRRSVTEMMDATGHFDTVVFDEGDWADQQIKHIFLSMPHALKFAMTGACHELVPKISDLPFVMITNEAVADYARAQEFDACLKHLSPKPIIASPHDGYHHAKSGIHGESQGIVGLDHQTIIPAILRAARDCDAIETRMREQYPNLWYSPHIIVKFDSISMIGTVAPHLSTRLKEYKKTGALENEGWDCSYIFAGARKLPPDEQDLSAKDGKTFKHPFMVAKNDQGRALSKSKRILLMCNIGVRGMNNWCILATVDCTKGMTITEEIQWRLGRPIRSPPHLAPLYRETDERTLEYITTREYLVESDPGRLQTMESAKKLVRNMRDILRDAAFPTWEDVLSGLQLVCGQPNIEPTHPPISPVDRLKLINAIGQQVASGTPPKANDIFGLVTTCFPQLTNGQRQGLTNYGTDIVTKPAKVQSELGADEIKSRYIKNPEQVIIKLKPKSVYSVEDELVPFVKQDPDYNGMWEIYVRKLREGSPTDIHSVSKNLHRLQTMMYHELPRSYKLQGNQKDMGVLRIVGHEFAYQLISAGALNKEDSLRAIIAVSTAAQIIFDIDDASDEGLMNFPPYHVAILGRCRYDITKLARALLIDWEVLANFKHVMDYYGQKV
jgi:hypothetical protein